MNTIIQDYKELDKVLDEFYREKFGRTERNNIDIINSNPTALLQIMATIKLEHKIDELLQEIKKLNVAEKKEVDKTTTVTKKSTKK